MEQQNVPVVTLAQGTIIGIIEQDIALWRGIPYATPPVGELRWRAPRPPVRRDTPFVADTFGPACWQDRESCQTLGGGDPGPFSEDCLYLNIWRPREHQGPLPVMVWLHGGGYTIGAASLPPYEGKSLARRGAVVVTVNYRLGQLGFFAHPALAEEQQGEALYNFGLSDQIAALRWIQDNIAAFGGDAHNITLFGESAGARSVLSLMASPRARGLFHKAIVQSAYTLADLPAAAAARKASALGAHFGLEQATLAQLRAIPAQQLINLPAPLTTGPVPICGDQILPEPMLETFLAARQHPLPLMIGCNSDEASVMAWFGVDLEAQIQRMRRERRLGLGLIRLLYPGVSNDLELGRQLCRDMAFTTMGFVAMQAQQRQGQPCWRYWFDYVAEAERETYPHGTWHGNEVPYVFDTLATTPPACQYVNGRDLAFARQVADYWVQFATVADTHHLQLEGPLNWPACIKHRDRTLRIGLNSRAGLRVENRFMRTRMQLFKRIMRSLVTLD